VFIVVGLLLFISLSVSFSTPSKVDGIKDVCVIAQLLSSVWFALF